MSFKKHFIILLFIIFLLFGFMPFSYAETDTDYGIMPISVLDDYVLNVDGSYTFTYTHHGQNKIYKGEVTIPANFFDDSSSVQRWALFIGDDGKPYIVQCSSSYPTLYYFFATYNTITGFGVNASGSTNYAKIYEYGVNGKDEFYSHGDLYDDGYILYPSGFLYSRNLNVNFVTGSFSSNSKPSDVYNGIKNGSFKTYYIYDVMFRGTSPYLLDISASSLSIALGTAYEGYTYEDDTGNGLSVTNTSVDEFLLDISDSGALSHSFGYDGLKKYMKHKDGVGQILEIPFDYLTSLDNSLSFTSGHQYIVNFTSRCINSISISNFSYKYYDEGNFKTSFLYGSTGGGTGGQTGGNTTTPDDPFGGFTNSVVDSNDRVSNSIKEQTGAIQNQTSKIEEQTNAIEEQTEVNKNIFERIGDILNFLNPFSENFFVYKLIELLVEAIKSLFIPSDDFFSTYFDELKSWFSDRLGFLFYPFELILDILNRILSINFNEPIFSIPDINEPFTNSHLISQTSFNLNSLLDNSIFSTIHSIYLVCVDAFIVFKLVNLAREKYEEVTTK